MNENKEEMMITVPYDDFIVGIQALQKLIAIRRILKDKEGFVSGDIRAILGLEKEKIPTILKEVNQDAGKN